LGFLAVPSAFENHLGGRHSTMDIAGLEKQLCIVSVELASKLALDVLPVSQEVELTQEETEESFYQNVEV
jgi:hypothetical protein